MTNRMKRKKKLMRSIVERGDSLATRTLTYSGT